MATVTQKPPWHIGPVGMLATLWGAVMAGEELIRRFELTGYPEPLATWGAQLAALPDGAGLVWALGAFAALAGGVLLLLREGLTPVILALAALALAVAAGWAALARAMTVAQPGGQAMIGVAVLGVLFWLYARVQRGNGALG